MSRRRRKRRAAAERRRQEHLAAKRAAIDREMDDFARELAAIADEERDRSRLEIDEEERQRFEQLQARPPTWTGRLRWWGLIPLRETFFARSTQERDLMTKSTRWARWLGPVFVSWRKNP